MSDVSCCESPGVFNNNLTSSTPWTSALGTASTTGGTTAAASAPSCNTSTTSTTVMARQHSSRTDSELGIL